MGSDGINAQIRHHIYLQRLAAGEVRQTLPLIKRLAKEIELRILLEANEALSSILAGVRDTVRKATAAIEAQLAAEMRAVALYEGAFQVRLLNEASAVAAVMPTILADAVMTRPMRLVSGSSVREETIISAIKRFGEDKADEVGRLINLGLAENKTMPVIARDVRRVVETRNRIQAEALVRTLTNHAGSVARQVVAEENADILVGEKFLATLDFRTTMTCAGFDGKLFPVGEGPMPPLHYGCRSLRIMQVKNPIIKQGERASVQGAVDGRVTYGGWLKAQPATFQDDVLGKERASLFRAGKVSIERFTDDTGRVFTLDQLKAREGLL